VLPCVTLLQKKETVIQKYETVQRISCIMYTEAVGD